MANEGAKEEGRRAEAGNALPDLSVSEAGEGSPAVLCPGSFPY